MQIIKKITEDEFIATFLKGEVNSTRFGKHILDQLKKAGQSKQVIEVPNLEDQIENSYRRTIISNYRGYGSNKLLFENFPSDVEWYKVTLAKKDLEQIKYINYSYWVEISKGSRLAKNAAQTIKNGIVIYKVSNEGYWDAAKFLENGGKFPELILVSTSLNDELVILEGHLRLTAYFLAPDSISEKQEVILGISEKMKDWDLY